MDEPPSPPHAFSPFLPYFIDESDLYFDVWRGTGLKSLAYFAARNNSVPLICATQANDLVAVQTFLQSGIRIDEGGLEKETALHMACALGYAEIAGVLIAAGASVDATDHHGSTSLVHCARFCPSDDARGIIDTWALGHCVRMAKRVL